MSSPPFLKVNMNIKDIKVSFEHTTAELEIILAGLRKLPMELVQKLHDEIIQKANTEVEKQTESKDDNA